MDKHTCGFRLIQLTNFLLSNKRFGVDIIDWNLRVKLSLKKKKEKLINTHRLKNIQGTTNQDIQNYLFPRILISLIVKISYH